jgi:hypothetical protein
VEEFEDPGPAPGGVAVRVLAVGLHHLDLIRSTSLDIRAFSVAHPPPEVKRDASLRLTEHAANGDITVDVDRFALDYVATAWERQRKAAGGAKIVLVP